MRLDKYEHAYTYFLINKMHKTLTSIQQDVKMVMNYQMMMLLEN